MYRWFVFAHLVGVFGFLLFHGVSVSVSFRVRRERDPQRIAALLELSSRSIGPMWISLLILLIAGIVAGFLGGWWGYGWIWASIGVLVVMVGFMGAIATRYYERVRFISRAKAEGTEAVSDEELDRVLRSGRPVLIAAVGFVGLALILWMMMFKPSFGLSPDRGPAIPPPDLTTVQIGADEVSFTVDRLRVPAGERFAIVFDNQGAGVPHNVAVYEDQSATTEVFVGEVITGPEAVTYEVDALEAGEYFFRCDVHPTTMTGTLTAE